MKRKEILETIKMLASSQGFYGRLLAHLKDLQEYEPVTYEDVMEELENQNFKDAVDFILYLES